jgi:hypothetical protein
MIPSSFFFFFFFFLLTHFSTTSLSAPTNNENRSTVTIMLVQSWNQGVVVVTINYRTNVFGFPGSPDLPEAERNLGCVQDTPHQPSTELTNDGIDFLISG